jgi:hypothetical protein
MVRDMRSAASVTFFKPEFDNFLYAQVGLDSDAETLSVLSVLARLQLDPWKEAAELAMLPKLTAATRLTALLVRLPGGSWTQAESKGIADGLIELLPRGRAPKALAGKRVGFPDLSTSTMALVAIAVLLAVILAIGSLEQSRARVDEADWIPSRVVVPQTSPQ